MLGGPSTGMKFCGELGNCIRFARYPDYQLSTYTSTRGCGGQGRSPASCLLTGEH